MKCCPIPGRCFWVVFMDFILSGQAGYGMRNGRIFPKLQLAAIVFLTGKAMGMSFFWGIRFLKANCWADAWSPCMICWNPKDIRKKGKSAGDTVFFRKRKNGKGKLYFWKPARKNLRRNCCAQSYRPWNMRGYLTQPMGLL